MVLILELEEGRPRILSLGDAGFEETSFASLDALTNEVLARQPELILVNPAEVGPTGAQFLERLNGADSFDASYALSVLAPLDGQSDILWEDI